MNNWQDKEDLPTIDGTKIWGLLIGKGLHIMEYHSPERQAREYSAKYGLAEPSDFEGIWLDSDDNEWLPHLWLPLDALPAVPENFQ